MSNYRRLISYIYAYEGGVKGKNIGFAKIETRGVQCKITVSVKKIYVGGNDVGVYLLAGEEEIFLGNIFIRGGSGEFRTVVSVGDVEHSGILMEECCGLTVHDVDNTWRCYTTIWEDAVAHAAEVELGDCLVNRKEAEEAVREARIKKAVQEIEQEFPLEPLDASVHSYIGKPVPAVEFSEELMPKIDAGEGNGVRGNSVQGNAAQDGSFDLAGYEKFEKTEKFEKSEKSEEIREPEKTEGPKRIEEPEYSDDKKEIREPSGAGQQDTVWPETDAGQNVNYYQCTSWESGTRMNFSGKTKDNIVCYRADAEIQQEPAPDQTDYGEFQYFVIDQAEAGQDQDTVSNQMDYGESQTTVMYRTDTEPDPDTGYYPVSDFSEDLDAAYHSESNAELNDMETMKSADEEQPVFPPEYGSEPYTSGQFTSEEENQESAPIITEGKFDEKQPVPGDSDELERIRRLEAEEENSQNQIWDQLRRERAKIFAFDYERGCEILTIKPQDIGLLPREVWVYGNNSFLLHGYYNYRYLILAKLNNPQGTPRYLLGVPGHYYSNERYMASMFGFPEFVLSKDQPAGDERFGYWYTDIKISQQS